MFAAYLRNRRRRKLRNKTSHPAMQRYLDTQPPNPSQNVTEVEYLAIDLEMTGLNAESDQVLSIGFVPIINGQVEINQAVHRLLEHEDVDLSASAPIHNIRNIDLHDGEDAEQAMEELLQAMAGRVLVFHHAGLDMKFLNRLSQQLYQVELQALVIDTMQIELKRLRYRQENEQPKVRLHDCRQRYNLPSYAAHNATIDAIATAELWLAQISHITADKPTTLGYFLRGF